jgi:Tfp pilus assembly protein PilX
MLSAKLSSRGFTLVASLLLTLLLSGVAIALLMMVTSEQRAGGADLSNNYTYRSAEGAMEKMTSDLANTFQTIQAPTTTDICNVGLTPPTYDPTVSFPTYVVAPVNPATSTPCSEPLPAPVWGQVASGADQGLYAQIIPVTLNVVAERMDGAETVSMTRTAEVALIPVFQYGVFSDSDLFYGQSPNLGFAGRVHTNGDLYLGVADGYSLVFGDKLSAFGNVIREQMDDGMVVGGGLDDGTVLIPTASNGCSTQLNALFTGGTVSASATCVNIDTGYGSSPGLGATNGSVVGGHGSAQNTATWQNVSLGTYNSYLIDGNGTPGGTTDGTNGTGATDLTLPFVNTSSGATAIQIIRQPLSTTTPTSLLGGSQLAYEAQIRVLLSDTQVGLHLPDWDGDLTGDVQLVGVLPTALASLNQGASGGGSQAGAVQVTGGGTSGHYYYFGETYCAGSAEIPNTGYAAGSTCPTTNGGDANFMIPPHYGPPSPWASIQNFPTVNDSNFGGAQTGSGTNSALEWPLIGGWLRVEAKWNDGIWHAVTNEWLGLGFARGVNVPQKPGYGCTSPTTNYLATAPGCNFLSDHKNAILYFQYTKDSKLAGTPSVTADYPLTGAGVYYDSSTTTYKSQYNWYPIKLYDAREGENYDVASTFTQGTGTPNGLMNIVELDVGNLSNWLLGHTGTTGTNVNYSTQNGYILYFSDRRGMQFATTAQGTNYMYQWGEYGFEDTVNYANLANDLKPDGVLDPVNYNGVSPEDLNGNGLLDNYGVKGVGDAYGTNLTSDTDTVSPPSPFAQRLGTSERIPLTTIGVANRVTGARHALKLVDGSLGNVPTQPPGNSYNNCSQSSTNPTACGGFTVGSENPVYIFGNYNTNCPSSSSAGCTTTNATYDLTWNSTTAAEPPHSAASVIADAVTLLSNNWRDVGCVTVSTTYCPNTGASAIQSYSGSMVNPINPGNGGTQNTPNRFAVTTYYRVAIAGGKTIAFNDASGTPDSYFGSDGGVHNFLRQLEDWSGSSGSAGPQGGQQSLYYKGSLVSLYWDAYATGTWKCCNLVYHPPNRQYNFDDLFSIPQNLPPGTPMFRNVDNLSYRQNQIARSN